MKKVFFAMLFVLSVFTTIFTITSCDSLWKHEFEKPVTISFEVPESLLYSVAQERHVSQMLQSVQGSPSVLSNITAKVSLHNAETNVIFAEKEIVLGTALDDTITFEDLYVVGDRVYAQVELTQEGYIVRIEKSNTITVVAGLNRIEFEFDAAKANAYTVIFKANGGSSVEPQTIELGNTVTPPTNPTRAGYNFAGWYKDESLTTAWNFVTDTVMGNTTLYAKWIANQFVYLGNDDSTLATGSGTEGEPFNNFTAAKEALVEGGIIYVTKTIEPRTPTWSSDGGKPIIIKPVSPHTGSLINVTSPNFTLQNITIDGETTITNTSALISLSGHPADDLTLADGVVIQNGSAGGVYVPESLDGNGVLKLSGNITFNGNTGSDIRYQSTTASPIFIIDALIGNDDSINITSHSTDMGTVIAQSGNGYTITATDVGKLNIQGIPVGRNLGTDGTNVIIVPNTYYVSDSGDNNNSGIAFSDAFATVQHAVNVISVYERAEQTTIIISGRIIDNEVFPQSILIEKPINILLQGKSSSEKGILDQAGANGSVIHITHPGAIVTIGENIILTGAMYGSGSGGGVALYAGTLNMIGGEIRGNHSNGDGGGVFMVGNSTFNLSGGTITGNNSDGVGGIGIWEGTLNISGNPVVTANTINADLSSGEDGYISDTHVNIRFDNTADSSSVKIAGPLTDGANIGLSPNDKTARLMLVENLGSHAFKESYFTMDDGVTGLERDGNNLKISVPLITMVSINGGTYLYQGTEGSDSSLQKEETVQVFKLAETEVTQAQWLAVMKTWPGTAPSSQYGLGDDSPAYNVSCNDAIEFCNALSIKEGLSPYYNADGSIIDVNGTGYRLPTEVEWEYAAGHGGFNSDGTAKERTTWAGTSTENELVNYAWYEDNSGGKTHIVGTAGSATPATAKSGNKTPLGLYDMSGNVWEWCYDGNTESPHRASRSGPWTGDVASLRVVNRLYIHMPSFRSEIFGFRVARSVN